MTTHDAPTNPATYLTITTEQLLRLDAAHPGARWWLKADAHGSWSGPVVNPLDMMKDVEDLDGHLREQILNNLDAVGAVRLCENSNRRRFRAIEVRV